VTAETSDKSSPRGFGWLFLLLFAAALSGTLIVLPGRILDTYRNLEQSQPEFAKPYLWGTFGALALALIAAFAVVIKLWLNSRARARRARSRPVAELSAAERLEAFERTLEQVTQVAARGPALDQEELARAVAALKLKHATQSLEIAAFGTISSGKSALLNALAGRPVFGSDVVGGTTVRRGEVPWPSDDRVTLVDTPGIGEVAGSGRAELALDVARSADVVLFVIDGALKSYEYEALVRLSRVGKRILVCINKADWLRPEDRAVLLEQLAAQLKGLLTPADLVVVQAQPVQRTRTRVFADGREQLVEATIPAHIGPLAARLLQVVSKDGSDLLLANLLVRAEALEADARERVRAFMDQRARAIAERHMWQAGAAAALVPIPLLDFAAGSAVMVKMALALAQVYGQPLTLDSASLLVRELGKNLFGVLGTNAILPAVTAFIGAALKMVPGAGTLAGSVTQGIVQALIARWAGNVLIEHFQKASRDEPGSLAELSRSHWKAVTQTSSLLEHVRAGIKQLGARERDAGEP
jgi:predicted GTPase/uncharacterized protein (DUF697 family)